MSLPVVLDTQVWLDWLLFSDPRCAALDEAFLQRRLRFITRVDCREEWRRVLAYPALALDADRQHALLAEHDRRTELLGESVPAPDALPRCRDRDDQKFLELASQAGAALLVSRDKALLALDRRLRRRGLYPVLPPQQVGDWLAAL